MPAMSGGLPLVRSTGQLLKYGRQLLENILNFKKGQVPNPNNADVILNGVGKKKPTAIKVLNKKEAHNGTKSGVEPQARESWTLAGYLARTTTRTLAAEVRRRAALQFGTRTPVVRRAYCRGTPLYAFVGLGLAGNQLMQVQLEEEGYDHVCSQIKEMFSGARSKLNRNSLLDPEEVDVGQRLEDYVIGPLIAKGCNSAVYSARLKETQPHHEVADWSSKHDKPLDTSSSPIRVPDEVPQPLPIHDDDDDTMSQQSESESSSPTTSSMKDYCSETRSRSRAITRSRTRSSSQESDITVLSDGSDVMMRSGGFDDVKHEKGPTSMSSFGEDFVILDEDIDMEEDLDDDAFYHDEDELSETESESEAEEDLQQLSEYPLALKMMFNYDAESNAAAILRTMENEAVPARMANIEQQLNIWDNGNRVRKKRLKPHTNVVDMFGVFVDDVPHMPDAFTEYPDALPARLNPDGCGRNKTLFIVMKRYRTTLREYLTEHLPTVRESTLIFCQLMEALLHVNNHGIAHRDLKSDNVLLEGDVECPHLVVTDFGCCLAEEGCGLRVPYYTQDTCKGGNGSLMAPEIATLTPGRHRYLDYRKSDLWAAGTLMYEIFGGENPFYNGQNRTRLDSRTYRSKCLPELPAHVPRYMQKIARSMLRWKPSRRPDIKTVTNALHLLLWGPAEWHFALDFRGKSPSRVEVVRWLVTFAAGVMCQRAAQNSSTSKAKRVEYALQCQFLARLDLDSVMEALHYLWSIK